MQLQSPISAAKSSFFGALIDAATFAKMKAQGLQPQAYLDNNDATAFFEATGDLLLPGPTGPSAFFMYENPAGERFTLYCGRVTDSETALRYTTGGQNAAYYWVDQNLAYVLSGPMETEKLREIAQAAYDQIDRRAAPPG